VNGGARLTSSRAAVAAALLAIVFLALHLPYLPSSLEDLDSINFALGLHEYDVARHRPHPPGYPVFIAIGRVARQVIDDDARALAITGVLAGTVGVLAIAALFRRLDAEDRLLAIVATALAVTCPLYWFTASRPLSDMAGLAVAVAIQALTIAARSERMFMLAAFAAGLAAGVRSQVLWLTVPLLSWKLAAVSDRCPTPVRHRSDTGSDSLVRIGVSWQFLAGLAAFIAGILCWLIPLLVLTGGPRGYWSAIRAQGAEDLSGIRMLWTTPTGRELADAAYYAFVAPWATWPIAAIVSIAAAIGAAVLWRRHPRALMLTAIAFGPYLAFDILFQETFTSRYALPLVVPIAFLAANGLARLPAPIAVVTTLAIVAFDAHVGGRSIAALSRQPAPAFQLLADMRAASDASDTRPVLAPDRRQSLDLRRPLLWLADRAPRFDRQLPAPPAHEWLEAVRYWTEGGRAPVWFAVDPRRSAIDLVQHGPPTPYRRALPYPVLMSGTRPGDVDWYRVEQPEWFAGEGWALTPEAAGVAHAERRGLAFGPIHGWIDRTLLDGGALIVGGRNFDPHASIDLLVSAGGWSRTIHAAPGFFADAVRVPASAVPVDPSRYVDLTIDASPRVDAAIEQFDFSRRRAVVAYGPGWQEPELDPGSGERWRWLSDRGELRYMTPDGGWVLHVEGDSPRRYYARDSRLVVRAGDRELATLTLAADFSIDVPIPAAVEPSTLILETDQTHVPAEVSWRRSPDRRRLGLRVLTCELRPASGRDRAASSPPGQ
jgi:hypothetical protein